MENKMQFQDAVKICFTKYVDFKGRARRSEFWWWLLFTVIVGAILALISTRLSHIGNLALLLPSLAVSVRRLQDLGKEWYWVLLYLIPIVGAVVLLIMFTKEGERAANKFGPDPKA